MPRQPRPDLADVPQHVVQRGNDRQPCFYATEDYRRYLAGLRESAIRYGCSKRCQGQFLAETRARLGKQWCLDHREELGQNWVRAQALQPLSRIPGADSD